MEKKKWFTILFYVVFFLVYALALTIPIGMVVKADDSAPADPPAEEVTAEEPPPEEAPPEDAPVEPPPSEPAPEPVYVEPVYVEPVYVEPAAPVEPPVVVEQPPAEPVPPAGEEQPPVEPVPPAVEEQVPADAAEPVVTEPEDPVVAPPVEEAATPVVQPQALNQPAGAPADESPSDGEDVPQAAPEVGAAPEAQVIDAGAVVEEAPAAPVEVLEALPEGANLVVLDQEGGAVPLASSEAEETLANGDPMYCAGTDAPGSASCISYGTIEAAIHHAQQAGNGDCTIYVEVGYSSPTHNTIVVDDLAFVDNNFSINIFGGYDLVSKTVVGQTTLEQNFLISNITGSLTLANFLIEEFSTSHSTIVVSNSDDVTLNNMDINNSGSGNAVRIDHSQNVTIQNSKIHEEGSGFGVFVHSSDDIDVVNTTIKEYGNDGGIYMENTDGVLLEKVVIQSHDSGCSFPGCYIQAIRFNNGSNYTLRDVTATSDYGSGLSTNDHISGYMRIFDSEFDDNGQRGVSIFSGGPVSITNTSVRDNHGDYGLLVDSDTIDLKTVHVDSNENTGALLFADGWIKIQTSTFSGNHHNYGLYAVSFNQYVDVNGIAANGNDDYGARLVADTYVSVFNSQFNANGDQGLYAEAPDYITVNSVTASGNGDDGIELNSHGNITVTCSVFKDNDQDGLESTMTGPGSTLTLNSVTISGNHLPMHIIGGTVIENLNYPCGGSSSSSDDGDTDETTTTPAAAAAVVPIVFAYILPPGAELIPVTGGEFIDLSCTGTSLLRLPEGEETVINQAMCGYKAAMELVKPEELPAPVPGPWAFVDGFTITLMFGENVVLEAFEGATYTVRFPITNEQVDETFHVLYWDAKANDGLGGWMDLGGAREALMWVETHDRTGTFVLVK